MDFVKYLEKMFISEAKTVPKRKSTLPTFNQFLRSEQPKILVSSKKHSDLVRKMKIFIQDKGKNALFPTFTPDIEQVSYAVGETKRSPKQKYKTHDQIPLDQLRMTIQKPIPTKILNELLPKSKDDLNPRAVSTGDVGVVSKVVNDTLNEVLSSLTNKIIKEKRDGIYKPEPMTMKPYYYQMLAGLERESERRATKFKQTKQDGSLLYEDGDPMKPITAPVYIDGKKAGFTFAEFISWYICTVFAMMLGFDNDKLAKILDVEELSQKYSKRATSIAGSVQTGANDQQQKSLTTPDSLENFGDRQDDPRTDILDKNRF